MERRACSLFLFLSSFFFHVFSSFSRSFIQPGRRNEWELLRAPRYLFRPSTNIGRNLSFFLFPPFRRASLREKENFPPSTLVAFLFPSPPHRKVDSSHLRISKHRGIVSRCFLAARLICTILRRCYRERIRRES